MGIKIFQAVFVVVFGAISVLGTFGLIAYVQESVPKPHGMSKPSPNTILLIVLVSVFLGFMLGSLVP